MKAHAYLFQAFPALLALMELPASFCSEDFAHALTLMNSEHGNRPLPVERVQLAVSILSHIATVACPAEQRAPGSLPSLLAPKDDGQLVAIAKLTFNDAPWLSGTIMNKDAVQFVHASIGSELAAALGVGSLREMLLVNKSLKKDIVCMGAAQIRSQVQCIAFTFGVISFVCNFCFEYFFLKWHFFFLQLIRRNDEIAPAP